MGHRRIRHCPIDHEMPDSFACVLSIFASASLCSYYYQMMDYVPRLEVMSAKLTTRAQRPVSDLLAGVTKKAVQHF